jgi:hypothetical protein
MSEWTDKRDEVKRGFVAGAKGAWDAIPATVKLVVGVLLLGIIIGAVGISVMR